MQEATKDRSLFCSLSERELAAAVPQGKAGLKSALFVLFERLLSF